MNGTQPERVRLWVADSVVCDGGLLFGSPARLEGVREVLQRFLGCEVRIESLHSSEADLARFNPNRLADWVAAHTQGGDATRRAFMAAYTGEPEETPSERADRERREEHRRRAEDLRRHEVDREHQRRLAALHRQEREREHERQRRVSVQRIAEERGIPHLTHVTRVENLPSILRLGLVGYHELPEEAHSRINDSQRWDNRKHAVCLSVSFPNFYMFYGWHQKASYAVILLRPEIMWELRCGFTPCNAATRELQRFSDQELMGADVLDLLFQNPHLRELRQLQSFEPTDCQSEVLAFERIPPEYIKAVHFRTIPQAVPSVVEQLQSAGIEVRIDGTFFKYRAHWLARPPAESPPGGELS